MSRSNPPGEYRKQPVEHVGATYAGKLTQSILNEMDQELRRLRFVLEANGLSAPSTGGGSGSGGSSSMAAATDFYEWAANGEYLVDTEVDGARIIRRSGSIVAVWLTRMTPGTSGSTILDVAKNAVTVYTTQANRPTIAFGDADEKVLATAPDITNVATGDIITVDTDEIEGGDPANWVLQVEVEVA